MDKFFEIFIFSENQDPLSCIQKSIPLSEIEEKKREREGELRNK
jgi:hypothetical protein